MNTPNATATKPATIRDRINQAREEIVGAFSQEIITVDTCTHSPEVCVTIAKLVHVQLYEAMNEWVDHTDKVRATVECGDLNGWRNRTTSQGKNGCINTAPVIAAVNEALAGLKQQAEQHRARRIAEDARVAVLSEVLDRAFPDGQIPSHDNCKLTNGLLDGLRVSFSHLTADQAVALVNAARAAGIDCD